MLDLSVSESFLLFARISRAEVSTGPGVAAATANALGALGGGKNLSVLLVEDDHSTLVFVKALLKSCGHTGTSRRAVRPRNLHTSASTKPVAHHRRPFLRDIFWKRVFRRNG